MTGSGGGSGESDGGGLLSESGSGGLDADSRLCVDFSHVTPISFGRVEVFAWQCHSECLEVYSVGVCRSLWISFRWICVPIAVSLCFGAKRKTKSNTR